ncbi:MULTISPECIES: MauE/DoxX family redox-associated membrane protein [unclassified Dietzia]|uniref:MauE/DoxX family redox-associated membrane protein n=1 Tax=unclassified Dietzia TaxID=2617939 RepID=UPI000D202EDB|nr:MULTISPECIES: MauE/DoxX family redox-associated membrane protein [unclassified Dietzia]AVZ39529.1 methylamine utilization protein [Dietzia sp. JS16-p6b]MBB1023844.1 methylamine utilization protein [Dietzia sp. DQ12-76]MBB1027224.1 methylamine utilization protein [Dietzia sp. DQ11-38-2]QGW24822.1 methylamine utilization protein MauE [Dietzia sp. DQ12-45-1b]
MTGMFATSVIGIALLAAGLSKLRDIEGHSRVVVGYKILPDAVAARVGRVLPFLEIVLGAACLGRVGLPAVAWSVAVLFCVYAAGLAVNLLRGRTELDCGCFAFGEHDAPRIGWWHVARALAFAAGAVACLYLPGPSSLPEVATGFVLAVLAVALAFGAAAVSSTLTLGRSRVDDYLQPARDELSRRYSASP